MNKLIWIFWLLLTIGLGTYFLTTITVGEDKSDFLIGDTTYGHYQIEMECTACHIEPFGGKEILQEACMNCHAEELKNAHDSHPKKKFTDPRDAYRLEVIDARYCISCHTEHHKERTLEMGLTLPDDYCYHCHQEIGEERESHKDLPYDSCATAGCHNFHDNRALYEAFLVENAHQPWLKAVAALPEPSGAKVLATQQVSKSSTRQFEDKMALHPEHTHDWQNSSHFVAGVTCGGCHSDAAQPTIWIEKPTINQCETCHVNEATTFSAGKHGMRLAKTINYYSDAISPGESDLIFNEQADNVQHGCNSCHTSHTFDTKIAAVESCLNCHADEHSKSYKNSPHGKLWSQELNEATNNSAVVTCATCHMPRLEKNINGHQVVIVDHNQNYNLRPNEKMIRPVCMNCHGLEFSIDALADPELIKSNFNGKPGTHIESVDWALEREQK